MVIDHVLLAAQDLQPAAERLAAELGLEPIEGGRHPGWGTANWLIPLGDAYLELVAVVDDREACESSFGRWVSGAREGTVVGWAVRPADLDAEASRLALEVAAASRTLPSGDRVVWRMAGVDTAAERPWLPFFIEWPNPASYPAARDTVAIRILRLDIEGDADELAAWLGTHTLPLAVRPGSTGVVAAVLDGPHGPVSLGRPREAG
jgi:Glyoxalase-like domain